MRLKQYILFLAVLLLLNNFCKGITDTTDTEGFKNLPDTTQLRILVEISDLCEVNEMPKYVNPALVIGKRVVEKDPQSYYVQYYAAAYNNEAFYYDRVGNIDGAIASYLKSLKIREEDNDSLGMAESYNNLASMFQHQADLGAALSYYNKARTIYKMYEDTAGLTNVYINVGFVYYSEGQYDSSQYFFEKGLYLAEVTNDINAMGFALNNLSALYYRNGWFDKTEATYLRSLELRKITGRKNAISRSHHNLGRFYLNRGNVKKALLHAKTSLQLALEINSPDIRSDADLLLSDVYLEQKMFEKSYQHLMSHMMMKDSILNEQTQKATVKQQMEYEYERQKMIDDKEHEKQLAISAEQEQKQKVIIYFIVGGLILVIIFSIIISNRLQLTRKQKLIIEDQKKSVELAHDQLEEKNTEIIDSINYAKRIQEAILPPEDRMLNLLPNSFILYQPKDIVAGDFYWIEQQDGKILFAAADCTGHGVPGAMVSVVCNNALNRSVKEYGLTSPGEVLDKTREIIINQFNNAESKEHSGIYNISDGMDIALCSLEGNTLKFAGAHNPLWVIRDGELLETKANKQPIGKFDHPEPFTTHTIDLKKDDSLYIFSDGYVDQFGGEKGKKFKTRAFKELLLEVHGKSMDEQKKILDTAFEKWKGDLDQVDDVCVIGVKI